MATTITYTAESVARSMAIQAHGEQRYGDAPYEVHLAAVVQVLRDFGRSGDYVLAGWLHDTVEDTPLSLATIEHCFGANVAAIVDACSGEGGDRLAHMDAIYRKIAAYPTAAIVKLADRIANVEASKPGDRHFRRYAAEQPGFEGAIYAHVPLAMWERLERAFLESRA